ncbi:MAG: hypothetical protein ABIH72_01745 [archaeon]
MGDTCKYIGKCSRMRVRTNLPVSRNDQEDELARDYFLRCRQGGDYCPQKQNYKKTEGEI